MQNNHFPVYTKSTHKYLKYRMNINYLFNTAKCIISITNIKGFLLEELNYNFYNITYAKLQSVNKKNFIILLLLSYRQCVLARRIHALKYFSLIFFIGLLKNFAQ